MTDAAVGRKPLRWHVVVFLAPTVLLYSVVMVFPILSTLYQSVFSKDWTFVGLANYLTIFTHPRLSASFWNALGNNVQFFLIHLLVQNPVGILLAAILSNPRLRFRNVYRTVFFVPTILSFVIVGFVWKLILSPTWGVSESMLAAVGLRGLFQPWLGMESAALPTLALISVWQYVGSTMLLSYAALLSIPDEVVEAAECDGIVGWSQFFKVKLPLILPTIGILTILTFIGNFNAFDIVYAVQGPAAGPNFSTDLLGTFLYRTLYGYQIQLGDRALGASVATIMFLIILAGVCIYLFTVQMRLRRYKL